jgi:hypothetical protein
VVGIETDGEFISFDSAGGGVDTRDAFTAPPEPPPTHRNDLFLLSGKFEF